MFFPRIIPSMRTLFVNRARFLGRSRRIFRMAFGSMML
jgi:hypothetical protein